MNDKLFKEAMTGKDPEALGKSLTWADIFDLADTYASDRKIRDEAYDQGREKLITLRELELSKSEYLSVKTVLTDSLNYLQSIGQFSVRTVIKSFLQTNRSWQDLQDMYDDCFIATAVYGSYKAPEVVALRHFRDSTLVHSPVGRCMIRFYYWAGPKLAPRVWKRPALRQLLQRCLDAIISHINQH